MRGRWMPVLLLCFAGCSDPETVLLPAGSEAGLVADLAGPGVPIMVPAATEFGPGMKDTWVAADVRVLVLEDKAAAPPVQPNLRLVKVRVAGGEHSGVEGQVSRRHLRP